MMTKDIEKQISEATEKFRILLTEQYERNAKIKEGSGGKKENSKKTAVIGLAPGDGIGSIIMRETKAVLNELLADEISEGKVELKDITGFTIEERLEAGETVPEEVLKQLEVCDVFLKGPTTTPNASMSGKNLESANVFLRRKFDLFANVRPVKVDEEGIDWMFFRENTEGEYALGSKGIRIGDEIAVDFKVTTYEGTKRIAKAAFDYAKENGKKRVSIVTKANILKKTDGDFQKICLEVAKDYPDIEADCWFIDIMAAKLLDTNSRNRFEVFVLPNLYGDIITDEAAQIQGGVGTAGSANIGSKYAMFEAIHGSGLRMVEEGRGEYANPSSLLTASVMMLRHIGYPEKATRLEKAIEKTNGEIGDKMTGLPGAATSTDFSSLVRKYL